MRALCIFAALVVATIIVAAGVQWLRFPNERDGWRTEARWRE